MMLIYDIQLEQVESIKNNINELSELLLQVVEDGASIGFLPGMQQEDAIIYWTNVISPEVHLFVAKIRDEIAGTVQLHLCTKQNGNHRVEIAKLMTHPKHRRRGIGRCLMKFAEERARKEGKTLIVLDTREGDPSNLLYSSLNYYQAGKIPFYAKSSNGELESTVFYYKTI
ncbi:GNAT family N-acetyltransferase [Fictibacillus phosphorivorans]|uniref:GNAT family N-acetyltransferase n=1 Tax=Fictibacillus phosphorivorans TaxID=1221500 RepID=UPI003CFB23A3